MTGAASGIGRTVAEALFDAGAAVLATDINPAIETLFTKDGLTGTPAFARTTGAQIPVDGGATGWSRWFFRIGP